MPAGDSTATLVTYLWQVCLHSLIGSVIVSLWLRRLGVSFGDGRRVLLGLLLVLPLFTAAVPGRASPEFREYQSLLASDRLLQLPLGGGLHAYHLVLALLAATLVVTLWQDVVPLLRRPDGRFEAADEDLVTMVRRLPSWSRCRVAIDPSDAIRLHTGGWPNAAWLTISRGALRELSHEELDAVVLHENAHWSRWRWPIGRALFVARLLQAYNPVALWLFREHNVELEIACDLEADGGTKSHDLARALFKVYNGVRNRHLAPRATLRRRIDVLVGRIPATPEALPTATLALASIVLAALLPWVV